RVLTVQRVAVALVPHPVAARHRVEEPDPVSVLSWERFVRGNPDNHTQAGRPSHKGGLCGGLQKVGALATAICGEPLWRHGIDVAIAAAAVVRLHLKQSGLV